MIYTGQQKKGNLTLESGILWRMRETPKLIIFDKVSENKSLRVKKDQTGRWGYVRPLFEDSWIIFDKWHEVYKFNWKI